VNGRQMKHSDPRDLPCEAEKGGFWGGGEGMRQGERRGINSQERRYALIRGREIRNGCSSQAEAAWTERGALLLVKAKKKIWDRTAGYAGGGAICST